MTFGIEFQSNLKKTVISSDLVHYICVESKVLSGSVSPPAGSDILTYTSLNGSSCLHYIPRSHSFFNFNSALFRVCVFRPADQVEPIRDAFGIELTDPSGKTTVLSDVFFMELYKGGQGSYASIALSPYRYEEPQRLPPVYITTGRSVKITGSVFTQTVTKSADNPTGSVYNLATNAFLVDVGKIPLNYLHPNVASILS